MRVGLAGRIAQAFVDSKLTPLLIAASLALGALALILTPREEEPQIRVPMVDVMIAWPGAEPAEIESRLVTPIERVLLGISGVEHVYAVARPGLALITARFRVNESNEESLVKVFERQAALAPGILPPGALPPTVELRSIDDVPFLSLTLSSEHLSSDELRPLAAELLEEISEVAETSKGYLIGGRPRTLRVEPDPVRMNARGVSWLGLTNALASAGQRAAAGSSVRANHEIQVLAGPLFQGAADVSRVVVAVRDGLPVYVQDVASVSDGPDEPRDAVLFLPGPASPPTSSRAVERPAVTVALAKRPGANATAVAERVLEKVDKVRARLLPADVHLDVTRNYGETAREKSNELVEHLLIATLSVVVLISLAMGWRSGIVVAIAVPVTLSLTLLIYYLAGYTLNRVTLFALIFSIGILVDDAIVVVENIERHHREKRGQPLQRIATLAVDEVGNPTILATFTVIAAILPLAFVRGLMGPYMRPIPNGASAAMIFSLAVAFIVSPWAACRIFRGHVAKHADAPASEGRSTRLYRRVMEALVRRPRVRAGFFTGIGLVLALALALVAFGGVKVKMLPFDNKSEFQVLVDQDEGTPLEATLETARRIGRELSALPEVKDVQIYAGTAAPFNFNGLVRHYFLRQSPSGADLQVNLRGKHERSIQSHDLAKQVRPRLQQIGRARGARVKVIEIPPGPPVLDTLVAEVYGPTAEARERLAGQVRSFFESTAGVVDADDSLETPRSRLLLELDREKAGLKGIPAAAALETIAGPGVGRDVGRLDVPHAREAVPVRVQLSAADRAATEIRLAMRVDAPGGAVSLGDLLRVERVPEPQPILHKDLKPLVYVFGDLAGERESPVYALAALNDKIDTLKLDDGSRVLRYAIAAPETSERPALKWDGEWQITYEVFRDMGIAFAVVMVLIAILVIGWFQSFAIPFAILLPIPLSLIGILPGHWAFGAFFTATSMIGFIAGAGIIVRNSIILVDFIELKLRQGMALEEAVVEAGAVRFRPMLLTAAAVVVGSFVILFDPIFQGLAISLMMGEVAATLLSRMAVPVVYYLIARRGRAAQLRQEGLGGVS